VSGTTAEKSIGQMIDEVTDRNDVYDGVEVGDGGTSGVVFKPVFSTF
jgi:hypothetical protein